MMLKNIIIFLITFLFIIIYFNVKSQNKDSIDINKKNICIIKFVPTDIFTWDAAFLSYLKLSIEADFPLLSNFYLGTKISKAISNGSSDGNFSIKSISTKGYLIELNNKIFLYKFKNNLTPYTGFYISPAITYFNTTTIREEKIWLQNNIYYMNKYMVNRDIITYKFLIGYQTLKKHKVVFDQSIEIGLQCSNNHSKNKIYPEIDNNNFDDVNKKTYIFRYNLKIGFTLNKKMK